MSTRRASSRRDRIRTIATISEPEASAKFALRLRFRLFESENTMLDIAQLGQPVLRQNAAEVPVETIASPQFQEFLEAMYDTLLAHQGAGLAAPQVFVSTRVFLGAIFPPEEEDGPPGVEVF